ncbi:Protein kinase-like domain [Pseudocohnilembus persalinus]|uniref:Protein kinase-like domain n=1 Tax=Pseudocohnilembus persalinus TaxID=266149 RepID=A0A0V0R4Z0_PSEPJ|nr:Protein kinase-like domain [Pseudocohnilembus persalinus]|eukprot:KRX09529.1 Protein kinase-like domain [Pseudocohnilembus persalinus]
MKFYENDSDLAKYFISVVDGNQKGIQKQFYLEKNWVPMVFGTLDKISRFPCQPGSQNEEEVEKNPLILEEYFEQLDQSLDQVVNLCLFDCFMYRAQTLENSIKKDVYFNGTNLIEFLLNYIFVSEENMLTQVSENPGNQSHFFQQNNSNIKQIYKQSPIKNRQFNDKENAEQQKMFILQKSSSIQYQNSEEQQKQHYFITEQSNNDDKEKKNNNENNNDKSNLNQSNDYNQNQIEQNSNKQIIDEKQQNKKENENQQKINENQEKKFQSKVVMNQQHDEVFEIESSQQTQKTQINDEQKLAKLQNKVKLGENLNKKEEEAFRKIALQDFYIEAIILLSQKALSADKDIELVYQCYEGNLNRLSNSEEAEIKQDEQMQLFTGYQIAQITQEKELKKFLDIILIMHIFQKNELASNQEKIKKNRNQNLINDLFMLSKIIDKQYFQDVFNKSASQDILKYIISFIQPEQVQDYLNLLFVERKLGNKKISPSFVKKYKGVQLKNVIQEILDIDLKDLRIQCQEQMYMYKKYLENNKNPVEINEIKYQLELKFKIDFADSLLYQNKKQYSIKHLYNAEDKYQQVNEQTGNKFTRFFANSDLWLQNLAKREMTDDEFYSACNQEINKKLKSVLKENLLYKYGYTTFTQNQANLIQQQQSKKNEENQDDNQENKDQDEKIKEDPVFYYNIQENGAINFGGFLSTMDIIRIPENWVKIKIKKEKGVFKFNYQEFSLLSFYQSTKVDRYLHLMKQVSPYQLNAYGILGNTDKVIVEPFVKRLFQFLQEREQENLEIAQMRLKTEQAMAESDLRKSEVKYNVNSSLRLSTLQNDKNNESNEKNNENQEINNKKNENQQQQMQQDEVKSEGEIVDNQKLDQDEIEKQEQKKENGDLYFRLNPGILVSQLIGIVTSMHMNQIQGYLSMYPTQILFLTPQGDLKTSNILTLLLSQKNQTRYAAAPEMYLKKLDENLGDKSDVWAIGVILYKIFWGNWIIEQEDSQIIEKLEKFKNQQYVKELLEIEQDQNLCFYQDLKSNQEYMDLVKNIIQQCLKYDPFSRPSSVELLLQIHQFLKKSEDCQQAKGIFSLYNFDKINKEILSLNQIIQNFEFGLEKNEKQNLNSQEKKQNESQQNSLQQDREEKPIMKLIQRNTRQKYSYLDIDKLQQISSTSSSMKQSLNSNQSSENKKIKSMKKQLQKKLAMHNQNLKDTKKIKVQEDQTYSQLANPKNPSNQELKENEKNNNKIQQTEPQTINKNNQNDNNINNNSYNNNSSNNNYNTNKKDIVVLKNKEEEQDDDDELDPQEIFMMAGGGVLVVYQNGLIIYMSSQGQAYVIYNKDFDIENVMKYGLNDLLQGQGIFYLDRQQTEQRMVIGQFKNGLCQKGVMIDQFLSRKINIAVDKYGIPKDESQYMYIEDLYNKQQYIDDQKQFQKLTQVIIQNYEKANIFVDFLGNQVVSEFDESNSCIKVDKQCENFMLADNSKIVCIIKNKGFMIDFYTLTYTIYNNLIDENQYNLNIQQILEHLEHGQDLKYYMLNGMKFVGKFQNYQPWCKEGFGVWKDLQGYKYEGQYVSDKKQGQGKEIMPNGDIYEGDFYQNKREGQGILVYNRNSKIYSYQGQFLEGKKHGFGMEKMQNGKIFQVKYHKEKELKRVFKETDKNVTFQETEQKYEMHKFI